MCTLSEACPPWRLCSASRRSAARASGTTRAVTASLVRLPFDELLRALPDSETAPPLYYVLAWIWARVFGSSDLALRSFSAVIGTLVVPAAFLAARELVSRRTGILVALFATVSPLLVWYSQEARAYSLLVLLSTLSLYGFARVWEAPSPRRVLFWAAVSCLAVSTYYFAIFLVFAEAAALLARYRFMRAIVYSSGAIALLVAVMAPLAFVQGRTGNAGWIDGIPMATRAQEAIRQLVTAAPAPAWAGAGGAESRTHDLWILAAVVVILAVAAVLRYVHGRERDGALLALGLGAAVIVVPLVLCLASGLVFDTRGDVFLYRALLPAWTPLAIVVAAGFGARRAGMPGLAAAGALVAASLAVTIAISVDGGLQRDDWQAIAAATVGEGLVVVTPAYQHRALLHYRDDLELAQPEGADGDGGRDRLAKGSYRLGEARATTGLCPRRRAGAAALDRPALSLGRCRVRPGPVHRGGRRAHGFRGAQRSGRRLSWGGDRRELSRSGLPASARQHERLEEQHRSRRDRQRPGDGRARRVVKRVRQELGQHHPEHRARRKAQPHRKDRRERIHEEKRRHCHERLGQAGEDAPPRRRCDTRPPGYQHEADCQPFRDVVHGDGGRDVGAERLAVPNETPIPTPSLKECSVITPTTMSALRASAPSSEPIAWCVSCESRRRVAKMNARPSAIPRTARRAPTSAPSRISMMLAPSMRPAATAFETPSQRRLMSWIARKGSAPRPVASAVTSEARNTTQTLVAAGS